MGTVVTYGHYGEPQSHERATLSALAQAIAALRGDEFAGEYEPSARYATPLYFVPGETVVGLERARAVGMRSADDLYGGVVPYAFLANKTIAHPLVAPEALAPQGWSSAFATRVREVVLPLWPGRRTPPPRRSPSVWTASPGPRRRGSSTS